MWLDDNPYEGAATGGTIFPPAGAGGGGMDWVSMGSSVLGKALQPSGGRSDAVGRVDQAWDHSGWNVNIGSGKVNSTAGLNLPAWAIGAALAVGLVILWKTVRPSK